MIFLLNCKFLVRFVEYLWNRSPRWKDGQLMPPNRNLVPKYHGPVHVEEKLQL